MAETDTAAKNWYGNTLTGHDFPVIGWFLNLLGIKDPDKEDAAAEPEEVTDEELVADIEEGDDTVEGDDVTTGGDELPTPWDYGQENENEPWVGSRPPEGLAPGRTWSEWYEANDPMLPIYDEDGALLGVTQAQIDFWTEGTSGLSGTVATLDKKLADLARERPKDVSPKGARVPTLDLRAPGEWSDALSAEWSDWVDAHPELKDLDPSTGKADALRQFRAEQQAKLDRSNLIVENLTRIKGEQATAGPVSEGGTAGMTPEQLEIYGGASKVTDAWGNVLTLPEADMVAGMLSYQPVMDISGNAIAGSNALMYDDPDTVMKQRWNRAHYDPEVQNYLYQNRGAFKPPTDPNVEMMREFFLGMIPQMTAAIAKGREPKPEDAAPLVGPIEPGDVGDPILPAPGEENPFEGMSPADMFQWLPMIMSLIGMGTETANLFPTGTE